MISGLGEKETCSKDLGINAVISCNCKAGTRLMRSQRIPSLPYIAESSSCKTTPEFSGSQHISRRGGLSRTFILQVISIHPDTPPGTPPPSPQSGKHHTHTCIQPRSFIPCRNSAQPALYCRPETCAGRNSRCLSISRRGEKNSPGLNLNYMYRTRCIGIVAGGKYMKILITTTANLGS